MALPVTNKYLAIVLALTFVGTFLLTPAGFETRPIPSIHPLGFVVLLLVFVAAALNVGALALLARRPRWAATLAAAGPVLFAPAIAVDQSGNFSDFRPPVRIVAVEWVQIVLEVAAATLAYFVWRGSPLDGRPPSNRDPPDRA